MVVLNDHEGLFQTKRFYDSMEGECSGLVSGIEICTPLPSLLACPKTEVQMGCFRHIWNPWIGPWPGTSTTLSLLQGNMSLITINRDETQKVHTHLVCAKQELSSNGKNTFSLLAGAAQKEGWWYYVISAVLRCGISLQKLWGDGIFRDELLLPGPSRLTTVCSHASNLQFAGEEWEL